jgi:hypothetical protein
VLVSVLCHTPLYVRLQLCIVCNVDELFEVVVFRRTIYVLTQQDAFSNDNKATFFVGILKTLREAIRWKRPENG